MNTWSKLFVVVVLLMTGYLASRAWTGDHRAWMQDPSAFPASLDANLFGIDPQRMDAAALAGGNRFDARVHDAQAAWSGEEALHQLRLGCRAWLRRLGYNDSAEREEKRTDH